MLSVIAKFLSFIRIKRITPIQEVSPPRTPPKEVVTTAPSPGIATVKKRSRAATERLIEMALLAHDRDLGRRPGFQNRRRRHCRGGIVSRRHCILQTAGHGREAQNAL